MIDKTSLIFMLAMLSFLAAFCAYMGIAGGVVWWIAALPAGLLSLVVLIGVFGALRGWKGGAHRSSSTSSSTYQSSASADYSADAFDDGDD